MIEFICLVCKSPFLVSIYRKDIAKTCKKECHRIYMSMIMSKRKIKERHVYKEKPDGSIEIFLENHNISFLIDKEDLSRIIPYRWQPINHKGRLYIQRTYRQNGKIYTIKLHRLLLNIIDKQIFGDHINGDTFDNRKKNLRIANKYQNSMNQKIRKDNRTKYKGVYEYRNGNQSTKPFWAFISENGKRHSLGYYKTAKEAAFAYNIAALQYHKEFAKLNIIESGVIQQ